MTLTASSIHTNTSKASTNTKFDKRIPPVGDSLNSPAVANVFKSEVSRITVTKLTDRAKALLAAANIALAKAGMPPIKEVRIAHLSDSATTGKQAEYDSAKAIMTINDIALKAETITGASVYVYHEAVHHQQSYNVARYLASSNGKSMNSAQIQAATGISKDIINKAVKSVDEHITKSPLSDKQFQTSKAIYTGLYDQTNTIKYDGKIYQYGIGIYTALEDIDKKIKAINKNPKAFTKQQISQVYRDEQKFDNLYRALPNEKEAFDVEKLAQPTKQGALKSSSQADNSSQNAINDSSNSSSDVSKVVTLLKENAAEIKKQYGLDINTSEGLGKAVMQYWQENNLDPKTLKKQLPGLKDSEFDKASAALTIGNPTETTKTKQLALH